MGQLVLQLADAYPEGLQHKDKKGCSPIDMAILNGNHATIRSLALIHPNIFDMPCSADRMIQLLKAKSLLSKRHRDVVSFFVEHCKNEWTRTTNQIEELDSKLASMKDEKDLAQNALKEEKKSVAALVKDKKRYDEERNKYQDKLEQERRRIVKSFEREVNCLKQQVDHAQKHNRLLEEARKSEAKELEGKLAAMKCEKDLSKSVLNEHTKELEKERKSVAALIKDKKKYDEERTKYQDKLEQEKQEVSSLKQQVDHFEKHIEEARKSEATLLSRILETGDDWAVQDLKSILQSLNYRLDAIKTQFQPGSQPSIIQIPVLYLLNDANPSKAHLLRTIEAINLEVSEVESNIVRVSTAEDAFIPEATRSSDANPENASRKRARVFISP
jgi:myosin heavy subunit